MALAPASRARAEVPVPDAPARWATDKAAFLSPAALTALDDRLGAYARQTGHQLLVYIDRTTGGVPIEDWAARAFARWRVGRKGIDDGAVLFIFGDDHRLRVEVGYGLEDRVPDVVASRIINDRMVPLIRAGNRDGAVTAGVDALVAAIGSPPGVKGEADPAPQAHMPWWMWIVGPILLILFLRFAIRHPVIASMMMMNIGSGRRGGGGWGGGGFGGGGGGGFSGGGGSSGGGGASGSW